MAGEPDSLYTLARRALLDGLAALEPHIDSLVVVGAQAIYFHTGPADLAVAEFTTDADLAIAPEFLADEPSIPRLLERAEFALQDDPGAWRTADGIRLDLLVPEADAGPGRRGARLPGHGKWAVRRAKGIEGALVDQEPHTITALDAADTRSFTVAVAGPAALLVAKIHKIAERVGRAGRLVEKDALDVLRVLQAIPTTQLGEGVSRLCRIDRSRAVTIDALRLGADVFGRPDAPGLQMAVAATRGIEDGDVVERSLLALWSDLDAAVDV